MRARMAVDLGKVWAPAAGLIALAVVLGGCLGLAQDVGQPALGPVTATVSQTPTPEPPTAAPFPSATISPSPKPATATNPPPSPTATTDPPPTPSSGILRAPITDPAAVRLTVHKSGVMCLAGPGGEYPVVQFFLPYYGFPFYFDPSGERTVVHEYPVLAKHFSDQMFSRGWWWKIDRGVEGEPCWVKQPPDVSEGGRFPYLELISISGDIDSVKVE